MRHLVHMASFRAQTNMHARNLAIVWAPNLLRSKDIEASGFNGTAAFMEVRVQSIVVEFILTHVDQLFGGATLSAGAEMENRWRSLPGTRASGSAEDLMPRSLPYHLPSILQAGDGPPQIRPYHTIIEIAEHKRKGSLKVRKWRSIFNLGRSGHETKRKLPRGPEDREDKSSKGSLRPARSMDSLSAAAGASDEPEGLVGPSSLQSSSLTPESLENNSVEIAEGEQDPEVETLGGVNSEPGTPQASRLATRAVGSSRAERCAGVHISDPYNVNLPAHITSILNVPPNIISNVSLARLTRGLECPALQPRPSLASGPGPGSGLGPGPPDEKSEEGPVPGPLADSDPADMTLSLEDSLSQEVQDSFSFLEDSSSSEPEWVGAEDGEVAQARATGAAFSLGEDDPGMGYLEELLGVGPQVEEFSVEPPLDDLSLDEAQYVLAPSCCSLDTAGLTPEVEEENGEEIFLSAYDDLSPLLEPKPRSLEGVGNLKEEATGGGKQPPLQTKEDRTCWAAEENPEAQPKSTSDIEVEAGSSPGTETEVEKASEKEREARGSQEAMADSEGGSSEETEAKGEKSKGPEAISTEETKCVEGPKGGCNKDEDEEGAIEREELEKGEKAPVAAGKDLKHWAQEQLVASESWEEVVPKQEDKGQGHRANKDHKARKDQGDGEDSGRPGAAAEERGESKMQGNDDVEAEDRRAVSGHCEEAALSEGPRGMSLRADSIEESTAQASETEQPFPLPPEPEGQFSPEGCDLWPSSFGFAGGVGMRLASTLVQVQQVRSVPVVPPKPQFAKMPSVTCSKIHVAPASPCPKPGRLDGIPTERALGSRTSRASWRNGGSLSFDAAVALARERHRTEAQGLQRAQTCTGPGEYNLNPRTSACSMIPTHSLRPLSYLELPPEGTEKSEARSRLSLPPREPHPPISVMSPQRRTYAFETQANLEKDDGL
nr:rho GTPase-activating protein 30 isoform X2 [Jaculus jaculus]